MHSSLLFISFIILGQKNTPCELDNFIIRNDYNELKTSEVLGEHVDLLSKGLSSDGNYFIKFYCKLTPHLNDTKFELEVDTINIRGYEEIQSEKWANDFRNKLTTIIKKFEPYIIVDSLITSDCKKLMYVNSLRKCY